MVPGQPAELGAVRTETGRSVKVVAGGKDSFRAGYQVNAHDSVQWLVAGLRVVFADANEAAPLCVQHSVGVADVCRRSQRLRIGARGLPVEPLVVEVREADHPIADRVGAPAVLMDARADVRPGRDDVDRRREGVRPDERDPAVLVRPGLRPVHESVVEPDGPEPDGGAREHGRRDGGGPAAVRGEARLCHAGGRPTITRVIFRSPPFVLRTSRKPPSAITFFTSRARSGSVSIRSHPFGRSHAGASATV